MDTYLTQTGKKIVIHNDVLKEADSVRLESAILKETSREEVDYFPWEFEHKINIKLQELEERIKKLEEAK